MRGIFIFYCPTMTPFLQEIFRASEAILQGQTILYPTDTIWGIGCDATSPEAIDKVYQIKQRPEAKSCIILLPDMRTLNRYLAAPPLYLDEIMNQYSDRPTTFVLEQAINLPDNLIAPDGTIAIRIPQDDFCQALLRKCGVPIVSTSANLSGHPSPKSFTDIDPKIKQQVDYIVQHRQEESQNTSPSRIVKVIGDNQVEILRP